VKNAKTIDYRIHHGVVGGRWAKGQETHIVLLADGVYKVSWNEPTGTTVSVANSSSQTPILSFVSKHGWPLTQPDRVPIAVAARKVTSTAQRSQSNGTLFLQRIRRSSIPDASSLPGIKEGETYAFD
jgi:hypothetical protein